MSLGVGKSQILKKRGRLKSKIEMASFFVTGSQKIILRKQLMFSDYHISPIKVLTAVLMIFWTKND